MPEIPVPVEMALVALLFAIATVVSKRRRRPGGPPPIFATMWSNLADSFRGWNALYWVLAVVATVAMVPTGWDRALQDVFVHDLIMSRAVSWFVLIGGNFWTLGIPLICLLVARSMRKMELRGAGVAGMQAVLATYLVTVWLKGFSGRMGPAHEGEPSHAPFPKTVDATDFAFDFWNHTAADGRFFWPSGHTASAITLVSALVAYYPEKRWIALIGYPFTAFTALAMVDGDMHWVSDVIAGALIGHAIGWTVGKRVRDSVDRGDSEDVTKARMRP